MTEQGGKGEDGEAGLPTATSDTWGWLPLPKTSGCLEQDYSPGLPSSSVWLWPLTVGEPGRMWDRSSKPGLREGETVSGLVSQEPVLCSEVAMVVVTLGGTGSSSSSSRREASGMSGEGGPGLSGTQMGDFLCVT